MKEYTPLDYRTWILGDEARKGVNIKKLNLLTRDELKMWGGAVPYQDSREDPGHGEMTVYFALKLLDYLPGNRKIVVPAALLHDTGWCNNDSGEWKKLVEANKENSQALETEAMRRPHQNRGILIAGRILEKIGYFNRNPVKYGIEIADIIGDHDTRKLPASDSGKIVRTADLIWRITYPCMQIFRPNESPENIFRIAKETCLSDKLLPHLGEIGAKIARIELANTICFKFPEHAKRVIGKEFAEEIELVKY